MAAVHPNFNHTKQSCIWCEISRFYIVAQSMFSNQDIDYSLNKPCRCLSAVAPASSSSKTLPTKNSDDDEDDTTTNNGWDDDNEDYLNDNNSTSQFTSHKFLVSSAIPSVSKLNTADDNNGTASDIIEEDDEERINKLYLLQYHEDSHELTQESTPWIHPTGEIWSMACHPTRCDWVVTCGGGAVFSESIMEEQSGTGGNNNVPLTKFHTKLWRIPDFLNGNGDNDNDDDEENFEFDTDGTRQRTESSTSVLGGSSPSKLEAVVTIPHGLTTNASSSVAQSSNGWEQRVGQILWNPLLSTSNSSGDALYDLADTSSIDGGGNLLTVGWDAQSSPISLWDISSLSDVKEVWSTHGTGGGVASSRQRHGRNRFTKLATINTTLPRRCSWDPHETHYILATSGMDVVAYDMRAPASSCNVIPSAHRYGVADICHNHLQSNVVVTSGMDGVIKFWDLRMHLSTRSDGLEPLATNNDDITSSSLVQPSLLKAVRGGHSHFTTRATYTTFYDQLVLSAGTDGIANLWRMSSCSSAPLLDLDDDEEEENENIGGGSSYGGDEEEDVGMTEEKDEYAVKDESVEQENWNDNRSQNSDGDDDGEFGKDGNKDKSTKSESNAHDVRVTRFECSDTNADVAWSASDPWVYATLSYDGAIVVHHVPSKEKYKILL